MTAVATDGGLQPERTAMAWSRTWLALVVVSAVFLRWLPYYGEALLALPLLTMLAALVIVLSQRRRTRRGVLGIEQGRLSADPLPPLLMLLLTGGLGAAGLVFVVLA